MLGAGGFGITYLAFDHQLNGPVALKEYFPAELATRVDGERVAATAPTNQETFAWGLERFLDEARAIHRFRHPNVVQARRYLEANGTAYIVMEYVEGESLKSILDRRGRLSAEEWRPWMDALLDGLEHVHSHSYLHRDVKPANIVVRAATGEPVLVDFGSARAQQRDRTHTQVLTAGYAPIEQYSGGGGGQGPPSDIYALAALSHRVLTGNAVPSAPDRVLNDDYEPLAESVSSADPTWMAAIDQALALRPQNRPQTVEAWRVALGAAQSGATRGEAPPPIRPVRTGSRHWWWAVPALFTLSIVILRLASGPPGSTPTPAATLDVNEQPFSETIHLSHGFTPNPRIVAVRGGGGINVSYLAGNCVGFAATGPDVRLHWSGASNLLGIAFHAEDREADASLIVNLPDGSWTCDDDSGDGLDPLIAISAPPEGQYDIWVGTHTSSPPYLPGRLVIREARTAAGREASTPPTGQDAGDDNPDRDDELRQTSRQPPPPPPTLDLTAPPSLGTIRLSRGFSPDPHLSEISGGGSVDASYLGGDCVGYTAREPDIRLRWSGATDALDIAFLANAPSDDATLLVNLPDTSWVCNDDADTGINPRVRVSAPPEGRYDIWVGAHTAALWDIPGILLISEASGAENPTTSSRPARIAQQAGDELRARWFTRGSHQDDVLRLQGTPTRIRRYEASGYETWSYGLSSVDISSRTRQVLEWSNHGGNLKVRLLPGDSGTDTSWFTRGSHQDDVLRLQGTPTRIRRYEASGYETWSYGLSSVDISSRTRQVLEWSNHGGNLRVRPSEQR